MKEAHAHSSTNRTREGSCLVCGKTFPLDELRSWASVRTSISDLIANDHPDWGEGKHICRSDLSTYRRRYVESLLEDERGEVGALERQVVDSLESGEPISELTDEDDDVISFGERMADRVAAFGGSWTFIVGFLLVLATWMTVNVVGLLVRPFDPYPFILLNLVLSCIAALQAPVIMMSQRRQEAKDRRRAENDFKVNLKAELEIRNLHEKIDHQLAGQWKRLAEMQEIQIDLLEERDRGRN